MTTGTDGIVQVGVVRHAPALLPSPQPDEVIDERPVALVFNGVSHVVMMATPVHLDDLAVGFALSEGLLHDIGELRDLDVRSHPQGLEVHLDVSPRALARLQQQRRQLAGRTGCGLCGIDSLQAFQDGLPVPRPGPRLQGVDLHALIAQAQMQLPGWQALQARTGGCHAAAWVDAATARITLAREDVGRHNALDKLIGARARARLTGDAAPGLVLVSSRASYEMVAKCVRSGVGGLAAISAPTALAIELAQRCSLPLWGFCRQGSAVAYA